MSEGLNFKVERIYRLDNGGIVKAFADVSVNNSLLLKGIKVIEGQKGTFVSMPRTQGKDQRWYESFKIMDEAIKKQLSKIVLDSYKQNP